MRVASVQVRQCATLPAPPGVSFFEYFFETCREFKVFCAAGESVSVQENAAGNIRLQQ